MVTVVMQCLSLKRLLCIHNCFARHIPCGKLSADVVVLQTDVGVILLKQGQHLPCGALVSRFPTGKRETEKSITPLSLCMCMCVCCSYCSCKRTTFYIQQKMARDMYECPSCASVSWCCGTLTFCWQGRRKTCVVSSCYTTAVAQGLYEGYSACGNQQGAGRGGPDVWTSRSHASTMALDDMTYLQGRTLVWHCILLYRESSARFGCICAYVSYSMWVKVHVQ